MNTGTISYINQIRNSVEAIRNYNLPAWQIDYEKYGGLDNYHKIKNMYWGIFNYYNNTDISDGVIKLYNSGVKQDDIADIYQISQTKVSFIVNNINNEKYDATDFPLTGYDEDTTKLLKEFRKDLNEPIKKYE